MLFGALIFLCVVAAKEVVVTVSCENGPSSWTVNSVANGKVTVYFDDTLIFQIGAHCDNHPFQIISGSTPVQGVVNNGVATSSLSQNVTLSIQTSTPRAIGYRCMQHSGMHGEIEILDQAYINGYNASVGLSTGVVDLSWSVSANACVWSSWNVTTTNSNNTPCMNLPQSTTHCSLTDTKWEEECQTGTFWIQEICTDVRLNSLPVTASFTSGVAVPSSSSTVKNIKVTCDSMGYYLDQASPNNVTVTLGNTVNFYIDCSCADKTFTITEEDGTPYPGATSNPGSMTDKVGLKTNSTTPSVLGYQCSANPAVKRYIIVNMTVPGDDDDTPKPSSSEVLCASFLTLFWVSFIATNI